MATPTQLFEALLKPTQNYSPQIQEERLIITSAAVAYSCQATDYSPDIYRCPFGIFNLFLRKSLKLDCFLLYIYFLILIFVLFVSETDILFLSLTCNKLQISNLVDKEVTIQPTHNYLHKE